MTGLFSSDASPSRLSAPGRTHSVAPKQVWAALNSQLRSLQNVKESTPTRLSYFFSIRAVVMSLCRC